MICDVNTLIDDGSTAGLATSAEMKRLDMPNQLLEAQTHLNGQIQSVLAHGDILIPRGAQMPKGDMIAVLALVAETNLGELPDPPLGKDLCLVNGHALSRHGPLSADEIERLSSCAIQSRSSPGEIVRSPQCLVRQLIAPWENRSKSAGTVEELAGPNRSPISGVGAVITQLSLRAEDAASARRFIAKHFAVDRNALSTLVARQTSENSMSAREDHEYRSTAEVWRPLKGHAGKFPGPRTPKATLAGLSCGADAVTLYFRDRQQRAARAIVAVLVSLSQENPWAFSKLVFFSRSSQPADQTT